MNRIQILRQSLISLNETFFSKDVWSEEELSNFQIECMALFETISLHKKLVDNFLIYFNSNLLVDGEEHSLFIVIPTNDGLAFKLKPQSTHLFTIKTVFKAAGKKIEMIEDEERIIPRFILNYFEKNDPDGHIYAALSSIDRATMENNTKELTTSANSLLDNLLSNIPELVDKKHLNQKLNYLNSNHDVAEANGVSKEMVIAFNNSRIIRNDDLTHPKAGAPSVPYIVALSYAYLVVFQLKLMLSKGKFSEITQ